MKYSIIFLTGKQFLISSGKYQTFDLIHNLKIGDLIFINKILLIRKDSFLSIGRSILNNIFISAFFIKNIKGPKIIVLKNRPKKNYTKKQGYRHLYSHFFIE